MKGQMGRMPGGTGAGPGGSCSCSVCGHSMTHATGRPCYEMKCSKCGNPMRRG